MRKIYKAWSILVLLVMLGSAALAQERTVSGKVTGETGTGMPGVNVIVKGTANGTSTDADGMYSLAVSGSDAIIVVPFVGYRTQEVSVGTRSTIDVELV